MTGTPKLFVGNKNYSSWSMRPWLALKWTNIDFTEVLVPLGPRGMGPDPRILAISPSGTVPALELADGERVWDSLSICEWAHETAPDAGLWPKDAAARAVARSAVCEMHAGFGPLRQDLPMNIRRRKSGHDYSPGARANIERVDTLLSGLRARFDTNNTGWIFGSRTIVDAFYAPVATRFRTYNIALSEATHAWCETVFSDAAFQEWERAAIEETLTIGESDAV